MDFVHNLHGKGKTIKLIEIMLKNIFDDTVWGSKNHKRNTDKLNSISHSTNENVDKGNKHDKFGENTCRDLQYRVYKILLQTNNERAETTAGKWTKVMTKQFTGRKRPKTYQACDKSSNISNWKSGPENNNTLHAN